MLTPSIQLSMKIDAVLKAHPPTSDSGVRSGPVPVTNLKITQVDPLDPQLAERLHFQSPMQMKQAFTYTNLEISHGMYLEVGAKEYAISGVAAWADEDGYRLVQMILEDIVVV